MLDFSGKPQKTIATVLAFSDGNATMNLIHGFENHVSYFVQNRKK